MENIEKKQQKVYLLCGPAGVGKSTWAVQHMEPETDVLISRDNIRFMMLRDDEPYFAVEDRVRKMFFECIENRTSDNKYDAVFIDATHLVPKSRAQVMHHVKGDAYCIAVSFEAPAGVAIERNKQRIGRALVPESVIYNMKDNFVIPTLKEGFDEIWHVDAEGVIRKEVKNE